MLGIWMRLLRSGEDTGSGPKSRFDNQASPRGRARAHPAKARTHPIRPAALSSLMSLRHGVTFNIPWRDISADDFPTLISKSPGTAAGFGDLLGRLARPRWFPAFFSPSSIHKIQRLSILVARTPQRNSHQQHDYFPRTYHAELSP